MTKLRAAEYDTPKLTLDVFKALMGDATVRKGISIRAFGVCPKCQKPFFEIKHNGYICLEHETIPRRFFLDLWWKSSRVRLYSDRAGNVLSSYELARDLKGTVETEIKAKTFDPTRYVKRSQTAFLLTTLMDSFHEAKKRTVAPSYRTHYARYVKIIKEFYPATDVREIRKVDTVNLQTYLEASYVDPGIWKNKTLKNCMDIMKTFMNWLKDDLEIITKAPGFPEIELDEPLPKWVHGDAQLQLFELVREEDRPIVGFLMLHGLRPGEARALRCKDVDPDGKGTLTIHATFSGKEYRPRRKGKKAKPFYAPIHPEAKPYLEEIVKGAHPEAYVFPNPRTGRPYTESSMRRVWGRVKKVFPGIRLYDASRHSYVSQLVAAGVSIYIASKLVGHTSVKTTEKYAHANMDSLRVEIEKVSLKGKVVPIGTVRGVTVDGKGNSDDE